MTETIVYFDQFTNICFCLGARSFYVIDTDKKQLIEVEANSKDELEKFVETNACSMAFFHCCQ
jgi:hypothetical protein